MPWTVADVEEHNKGLSAKKKKQWVSVANSALQKCIADGGTDESCAPGAIRQANAVVANMGTDVYSVYRLIQDNSYQVRTETLHGRKHIVVPVIMMVEGVHNGSRGPLLHTASELGKIPMSWDDMPIVVGHPECNGEFISACAPEVIEQELVGRVYHTHLESNKLKAEAWLDEERLKARSNSAYGYIIQNHPLEVSVGVFTDDEMKEGLWNGETYTAIAHNHRPDHLALLPGGTGACSWEDGCGIRANQQNTNQEGGETMPEVTIDTAMKVLVVGGYSPSPIKINGEVGLRDRLGLMQTKLNELDTLQKAYYLQEMFDNYIIYEMIPRGEAGSSTGGLYKQGYHMTDNEEVEFTGDPVEVKKEVKYVAMSGGQNNNLNVGGVTMLDPKKKCCPEKIKLLVQSKGSPFQEADSEWLETLEEAQVDKLVAMASAAPGGEKDTTITKEQAMQVLQEQLSDPDKFIKLLPGDVQEQIRHGMALHKAEKQKLITLISANSEKFTPEKLAGKSIEELQDLASLIKLPDTADYSLLGGGNGPVVNAEDLLPPPGIEFTN